MAVHMVVKQRQLQFLYSPCVVWIGCWRDWMFWKKSANANRYSCYFSLLEFLQMMRVYVVSSRRSEFWDKTKCQRLSILDWQILQYWKLCGLFWFVFVAPFVVGCLIYVLYIQAAYRLSHSKFALNVTLVYISCCDTYSSRPIGCLDFLVSVWSSLRNFSLYSS